MRVQYGAPGDSGEDLKIAYTGDVGPNGCHVVTTTPALPGVTLDMELSIPGGTIVKIRGVVRWAKKVPLRMSRMGHGGFGVSFDESPEPWYAYCFDMQQRADQRARRQGMDPADPHLAMGFESSSGEDESLS